MGLFDKLKRKSTNSAGAANGEIDIHMLTKGMLELQKLVNEHYLPQIEKQIADPNVKNTLKKLTNLNSDEELKAYLLLTVLKRDLGGITRTNVAALTILKNTFGIDVERGVELIKMVED